MAMKAYEEACARAELFGQPFPDKDEFLEKHKHLDVVEFEEVEIGNAVAESTAMLDDSMKQASGGLVELNTILDSTQTKINKLKGVCTGLTNFFRVKLSAKDLSYSSEPSYVGQTNYDKDYIPPPETSNENSSLNEGIGPNDNEMTLNKRKLPCEGGDINSGLNDLEEMEKAENASMFSKATEAVTSQFSKLDRMMHQAEKAETKLQDQNKQMRSFLR